MYTKFRTLRCRVAERAPSSCLSSVCNSFTLISPRSSPIKCLFIQPFNSSSVAVIWRVIIDYRKKDVLTGLGLIKPISAKKRFIFGFELRHLLTPALRQKED